MTAHLADTMRSGTTALLRHGEAVRLLGICHRSCHCPRRPSGCHFRQQKPIPATPKTLGDVLRKKRVEAGLFQRQVAAQIGVSTETIKMWEHNKTKPVGPFYHKAVSFVGFDAAKEVA